ncbi:MAG: hypothetical protein AMS18_01755 [Gemmatimonas sp. SG8_17]|nr:MAG: hypothetical protein AMS18_01755 [Gemmatimonas sp. SG8_17]
MHSEPASSQWSEVTADVARSLSAGELHEVLITVHGAALSRSLLRGVAHDLSNASQVFSLNTSGDDSDSHDSDAWQSTAQWVSQKLSRAIALLRDFATVHPPDEAPVVVNDVITTVHEWQTYQKPQPPVPVRLELVPGLAAVRASEGRLRHVLLELIANAKEAVGASSNGEILVTAYAVPEGVSVTVEDNGPGIPTDLREKIFEPGYTTKDPAWHGGLGLAASRSLVTCWGGSIQVEAGAEGSGTRMLIRLKAWPGRTSNT